MTQFTVVVFIWQCSRLNDLKRQYFNRALKSHALSMSLAYFDTVTRSHAETSISHALALFWYQGWSHT